LAGRNKYDVDYDYADGENLWLLQLI